MPHGEMVLGTLVQHLGRNIAQVIEAALGESEPDSPWTGGGWRRWDLLGAAESSWCPASALECDSLNPRWVPGVHISKVLPGHWEKSGNY